MNNTDVLIIGAGMSGIGLGVHLIRKFGTRNFEIFEKDSAIAGTWRVNSYPGCGCDVCISNSERSLLTPETGSIPFLLILLRSQPQLVSSICYATRDTDVLQ
jgi:hypothetical protein